MNEYVNRKDLRDALYDRDAVTMEGVKIINQFPLADVAPVRHALLVCIVKYASTKKATLKFVRRSLTSM